MTAAPEYPTAREIAVAIVAAAKIRGEDPVDTFHGVNGMRGRFFAFVALHQAFPSVSALSLTRRVGLSEPRISAKTLVASCTHKAWWSRADLKDVSEALAAAIAETDAELRARIATLPADRPAPIESPPKRKHRRVKPAPPVDLPPLPLPVQGQGQTIYDRSEGAEPTAIISPASVEEEKIVVAPVPASNDEAKRDIADPPELDRHIVDEAQPEPKSEPEEQPSSVESISEMPESPSNMLVAEVLPVAAFHRNRVPISERVAKMQRQENIRRANEPRAGSGFDAIGEIHMRPNAPGERARATPLPPEAYGDPDPGYRARRAEADARIAAEEERRRLQQRGHHAQISREATEDEE